MTRDQIARLLTSITGSLQVSSATDKKSVEDPQQTLASVLLSQTTDFEDVKKNVIEGIRLNIDEVAADYMQQNLQKPVEAHPDESMPLSSQLGLYRILRPSPLSEVPFICCTE